MSIHPTRVSENGRFLLRTDGQPFFWFADTAWELFHRLNRKDAAYYLQKRVEQKFTVVQAVILGEFNGILGPNAYGDPALRDADPTRPNEPYFRHVDWIVTEANRLGLTLGILPTWGDKVGSTHGDGPRIFTVQNARIYGECLGRRYKDCDLVWILGGDRLVDSAEKLQIWRAIAEGLRIGDGRRHLITFHPPGGDDSISTSSYAFPNSDPVLDFNMRQNGHCDHTKTWSRISSDYSQQPVKPVLDGEPLYEDHPISFNAADHGYSNAHDIRRFLYLDLFAGAFGHTYGHHSVWQFHAPGRGEGINKPISYWREAMDSPGANQIQHARALIESRPFLSRIPDSSLIHTSLVPYAIPGAGTKFMGSTRSNDGSYGMIYLSCARAFLVNPQLISGEGLRLWWFNPRDGSSTDLGVVQKRSLIEVFPPFQGEDIDWVLIIDDAARDFPPPGAGPSIAQGVHPAFRLKI